MSTETPTPTDTHGLTITEIKVTLARGLSHDNPVRAFAKIVLNGAFALTSIRVVQGKFGMFVSYPREYNKTEGKGYNLCYPITKTVQEAFSKRILDEYQAEMEAAAIAVRA